MITHINKSIFNRYRECKKDAWLAIHKPDVVPVESKEKSRLTSSKDNLADWAYKLFPGRVEINSTDPNAAELTQQHIAQRARCINNATFIVGQFRAVIDILAYDAKSDSWSMCEIKYSTQPDGSKFKGHVTDAAYAWTLLQYAPLKVKSIYFMYLNKEFKLADSIDLKSLYIFKDVTAEVKAFEEPAVAALKACKNDLLQSVERAVSCECHFKGRSAQCSTFSYSHAYIPAVSVHDLSTIGNSKSKLKALIDRRIYNINDIPDDFGFDGFKQKQIVVHKTQKPFIDYQAIQQELATLKYPLYFLDYETCSMPIPKFKGYVPYQQTVFQYSLHVLHNSQSEPQHYEYLHEAHTDPSYTIVRSLYENIGSEGTVVSWNASFEKCRNIDLAALHTDYESFLVGLNDRMYDLRLIFSKPYYAHPGFNGKTSIKNILPVIVPELTYTDLDIQKGDAASDMWYEMIYGTLSIEDKHNIAAQLRAYCKMDTYAMYAIFKHLTTLVGM